MVKNGWQGERSELAGRLSLAAALLGLGALLLLPGPTFALTGLGLLAASIHIWAWFVLGWAVVDAYLDRIDTYHRIVVLGAFLASVVSFVGGLLHLILAYPGAWGFTYLLFPYVPSVYGPAVIAHSVLFLASARSTTASGSSVAVTLGSLYLMALATIALWSQATIGLGVDSLSLAGLTSVGYLLVAAGWSFGRTALVSGAPDLGSLVR